MNATSWQTSHAIILPENVLNKRGIMYYATWILLSLVA